MFASIAVIVIGAKLDVTAAVVLGIIGVVCSIVRIICNIAENA